MSLRRGFKAEAERIAKDVRSELGLTSACRLVPLTLAQHLEIPILTIADCIRAGGASNVIRHLVSAGSNEFSAVTVFFGRRRVIVHNESHAPTRQANSLAHELSHCLLEHPSAPVSEGKGRRYWDATLEDEANWLAGALLVPRDGALNFLRRQHTIGAIAAHYGVSVQLCRWRIYQTGIHRQVPKALKSA